jgi:hypothetical protein
MFFKGCKYQFLATRGSNPFISAYLSKNFLLFAGDFHVSVVFEIRKSGIRTYCPFSPPLPSSSLFSLLSSLFSLLSSLFSLLSSLFSSPFFQFVS